MASGFASSWARPPARRPISDQRACSGVRSEIALPSRRASARTTASWRWPAASGKTTRSDAPSRSARTAAGRPASSLAMMTCSPGWRCSLPSQAGRHGCSRASTTITSMPSRSGGLPGEASIASRPAPRSSRASSDGPSSCDSARSTEPTRTRTAPSPRRPINQAPVRPPTSIVGPPRSQATPRAKGATKGRRRPSANTPSPLTGERAGVRGQGGPPPPSA